MGHPADADSSSSSSARNSTEYRPTRSSNRPRQSRRRRRTTTLAPLRSPAGTRRRKYAGLIVILADAAAEYQIVGGVPAQFGRPEQAALVTISAFVVAE